MVHWPSSKLFHICAHGRKAKAGRAFISRGIEGRQCADIAHAVAAKCERAILTKQPICSIEFDTSKCFDRISPWLVADLAIALGIHQGFLSVWFDIYKKSGICRVGSSISRDSLESANGSAQGDSLSVLAINILMTWWADMVNLFRVFPRMGSLMIAIFLRMRFHWKVRPSTSCRTTAQCCYMGRVGNFPFPAQSIVHSCARVEDVWLFNCPWHFCPNHCQILHCACSVNWPTAI